MGSMRCKISGHDPDPCGVCRRCGDATGAQHEWKEVERDRPCFRRTVCERCEEVKEQPEHDWEMSGESLKCSRCGMAI